ncbi:MAG: hypothetical protein A2X12_04435 [Bacteroidetes bacterium GWE2_29_8]|nr:MAG: hypothetical protein A2X12_04435 [Bacteroidetes bacterium GWE2_29_8]OFY18600.1 MAG: hypothetical protein A2X02_07435 [Bacteroidetes bacterium GWF2_29_10]
MKTIELLSPAKDIETGIAAINCGADAIYIGASNFGARKNANNDIASIEKLIKYAHLFNVKVYITINTIIYDNEIEDVEKLINSLHNIGADAIIFQDLGILNLNIPPIQLHASTQTDNRRIEKIFFFEKIGVKRVILPRELSLKQIEEIKLATNIELECFIHGALCMCYSGQCYFSLATTSRSGNRGDCSQPCRLKFSFYDNKNNIIAKDKHILSLKDINLSANIEQLINIGVSSLKIEGRLKDINYVKNITAYYRQIIDNVLQNKKNGQKPSEGIISLNFSPDPEKTFNRGYTDYFSNNRPKKLITELNTPKSIGQSVAKVIAIYQKSIKVELFVHDLVNGDGICFSDKNNELKGFYLNKIEKDLIYTDLTKDVNIGTILYRNYNIVFEKQLNNPKYATRKIAVNIDIEQRRNELYLKIYNDNCFSEISTNDFEIANNTSTKFIDQLRKTGDSIFVVQNINDKTTVNYFFKTSVINEIKRNLIAQLEQKLIKNYKIQNSIINSNKINYYLKEIGYKGNIANQKAANFLKDRNTKILERSPEIDGLKINYEIARSKYCILYELNLCNGKQKKGATKTYTLKSKNKNYKVNFDCNNCEMIIFLI